MTAQPVRQGAELTELSASALARAIRAGQVSSAEVVAAHLRRIDAVNPVLNAVVQPTAEAARRRAQAADAALARGECWGPLHGVPFTAKDALDTAGVITTGGTTGRAGYRPGQDATAVARLQGAGAILLGKTNAPECSLAFETDNLVYGRTNNPYDPTRTPGGSSGGEAAIISACGSPLGLGTDAAGSIRWPAHCCGIAGLKPTHGRVPATGAFPPPIGLTGPIWHLGPLARFVEDLALALPIIAGVDGHDAATVPMPLGDPAAVDIAKLRVAFHTDNGIVPADAATTDVIRRAAQVLADAGVAVEEERPAGIEQSLELGLGLFGADGGAGVQMLLQMAGTTAVSPFIVEFGERLRAFALTTAELSGLLVRLDLFRSTMLGFLDRYDVIVCPVNAGPAMPHNTTFERVAEFGYTVTHNLTGWPAAVVRGGASPDGLPIGVQVVARPWREDVALAVAAHLERVLGGWQPPEL
jgi:amidase